MMLTDLRRSNSNTKITRCNRLDTLNIVSFPKVRFRTPKSAHFRVTFGHRPITPSCRILRPVHHALFSLREGAPDGRTNTAWSRDSPGMIESGTCRIGRTGERGAHESERSRDQDRHLHARQITGMVKSATCRIGHTGDRARRMAGRSRHGQETHPEG